MWTTTQTFKERMADPVLEVRARVEILDTDFNTIAAVGGGGLDKGIIDGVVDLDVTRGTRRTLTMSLLNEDGEFSPTSQWGGLFYVNRLIRMYRGLVTGGSASAPQVEYVPVGTFMVDKTETLVERGMSTVVLAGSDLWKKFSKSQYVVPVTYAKGTLLNTLIRTIASESGVTNLSLDTLSSRTASSDRLQASVSFEKGDTRGDALMQICKAYSIDIYFDPMGVLRTQDFRAPSDLAVVWEFGETDQYPRLAYYIRGITDDERLYNHVYVTGTGDPENIYWAEIKNTDPLSPTNINRIGDRVYRMESGILASQESVDKAAQSLFHTTRIISQGVAIETICHPAFEGNDVVTVIEPVYNQLATKFQVDTLNIPLLTSKQKITMKRVISIDD